MQLTIRARHLDLDQRDQIHRRVAFALGRVAGAIRRVDVRVADINGPRGGLDQEAQIQVRGPGLPLIVIEQLATDPLVAVSIAADRAARAVVRRAARRRTFGVRAFA